MSNIETCTQTILVPHDPEKPVIGPFTLANGNSLEWHKEYARSIGYKDDEYDFRVFLSLDEMRGEAEAL